jgi:hypothetical protein
MDDCSKETKARYEQAMKMNQLRDGEEGNSAELNKQSPTILRKAAQTLGTSIQDLLDFFTNTATAQSSPKIRRDPEDCLDGTSEASGRTSSTEDYFPVSRLCSRTVRLQLTRQDDFAAAEVLECANQGYPIPAKINLAIAQRKDNDIDFDRDLAIKNVGEEFPMQKTRRRASSNSNST